jgi:TonB-dependent receptor
MKQLIILALMLFYLQGYSQNLGTLKGRVFDKTGEALIGVNVLLEGTTYGSVTDLDGSYTIKAQPGTYTLIVSYISYSTQKLEGLVLEANKTRVLNDIILEEEAKMLQEFVVKATYIDNTDNAITSKQQNSTNMLDGISAQSIKRTGDNNVAAAARRITGVSIDGGKYVYVRGLGDRYSKSILNGMEIPGLDPERNAVQLDLFPTSILDNIIVYKNFTPDLPGDFVGGLLDITTKNFPDKKNIALSASYGFNTQTTFQDDFILSKGSKMDWLGVGAKSRKLPFSPDTNIPNPNDETLSAQERQSIRDFTLGLNPELEVMSRNNFMNQSYAFNIGDQIDKEEATWGYNFSVNYRSDFEYIPDAEYNQVRVLPTDMGYSYDTINTQKGRIGRQNVLWNTLGTIAVKKGNNSFALQLLHTQNATKQATIRNEQDLFNVLERVEQNLEYTQRRISNVILSGKHQLNSKNRIEWANSFSLSNITEPDMSLTSLMLIDNDTILQGGGSSGVTKVFRFLDEINDNVKIDYTYSFKQWNKLESKLKVGASNVFKQRSFDTYFASLESTPRSAPELVNIVGGANTILSPEKIWSPATDTGYFVESVNKNISDQFTSRILTTAAYAMVELPIFDKFRFVGGLRVEYTNMVYSGADRLTQRPISKQNVLNSFQLLPSANFVVKATDKMNVRFSYNKTLARPSFREKSNLVLYDPVLDQNFIGNINLVETDIHNVDLRWEYYFGKGQLLTVSGFYKKFFNPIEVQSFSNAAPDDLTPSNRDDAQVFGVEVEFKKNFGFINQKLENLIFGTNVTYIKSMIDVTEDEKIKFDLAGVDIGQTREMQGQAPFIVNTFMSYNNKKSGTEFTLGYNVKGRTISIISVGNYPYVYEDPFHSLDLSVSQTLGKEKQFSLTLRAANLINDYRQLYYEFLDLERVNYRKFTVGRSFSLGFNWNIR